MFRGTPPDPLAKKTALIFAIFASPAFGLAGATPD
jgi:hypothetical protein